MMKYTLLLSFLLLSATLFAQQRPNIILIMADDMGYSDLGCYGSEIPTPNIDKLADKGLRFSQFYNTARCCPTRASLMTGLFPHQTGIGHMTEDPGNIDAEHWGTPGYQGFLNRNCATMAEVLGQAGYHTYMAGKWHLGMHSPERWPLQRGFEQFYGILSGAASYFSPHGDRNLTYNNQPLPAPQGDYYTTDAFTDSAIAFIGGQKDNAPFFLYLAYNAPHWPLQAKPQDIKAMGDRYLKGWDIIRQARYGRQLKMGLIDKSTSLSQRDSTVRPWNELGKQEQKDVAYRMSVYAAQVNSIDQNIGKLLKALEKDGKLQNTIIVFLSDNGACAEPYKELGGGKLSEINDGEKWGPVSYGVGWANASNTPFRKWKRELEEGGIAAPFILYWPEGVDSKQVNTVVNTPAYLIDVMPTFLEAAGARYPAGLNGNKIFPLEGQSLLPVVKGSPVGQHEYMFWEHEGNRAVRKGNWKAVKGSAKKEWELFDLSEGRNEETDVAASHPALVRELVAKWNEWANTHAVLPKRAKQADQ